MTTRFFWPLHGGKKTEKNDDDFGFDNRQYKCTRAAGIAVSGCIIPNCGGSATFNLPPVIPGSNEIKAASVTVTGGDLWNYGYGATMTCVFPPGPSVTPGGDECSSGIGFCTPKGTEEVRCPIGSAPQGDCCCYGSPIIIDISRYSDLATNSGNGYVFTDVASGVRFDIDGDGIKEQIAWPTATSENAWLALDRNGNGIIDNGTELFGNFTPQALAPGLGNGWLALAELDLNKNGGNDNLLIDKQDAAFPNLRLWIDRNHNGISEPNELITLESIGITRIDFGFVEAPWTDPYGNNFRFKGKFIWGDMSDPEFAYLEWYKDAWDVFPKWIL